MCSATLDHPKGTELAFGVREYRFADAYAFVDALSPLAPLVGPHPATHIFRGHADASWSLLPSSHRDGSWDQFAEPGFSIFRPSAATRSERLNEERRLLGEFLEACNAIGLEVPGDFHMLEHWLRTAEPHNLEWQHFKAFDFLALAQHNKIPTPLLDWTRLGKVAAYFAALSAEPDTLELAVWVLNASALRRWRDMRDPETDGIRIVTTARARNSNLHAQAGLFTVCEYVGDELQPVDRLVSSSLANDPRCADLRAAEIFSKFVLPREQSERLLRRVHLDGVTAATIFPGYRGAARQVAEARSTGIPLEALWSDNVNLTGDGPDRGEDA